MTTGHDLLYLQQRCSYPDIRQPRVDLERQEHSSPGLQDVEKITVPCLAAPEMQQSAALNLGQQSQSPDLWPSHVESGSLCFRQYRPAPCCSSMLAKDEMTRGGVEIPKPLPARLNLHLIKDVKAALHALRDVEQFLEHIDEQLDPGHAHMSGQWRCGLDGLETKLCKRKRCLKRAIFEALQS